MMKGGKKCKIIVNYVDSQSRRMLNAVADLLDYVSMRGPE
jgi:hypothetical protein